MIDIENLIVSKVNTGLATLKQTYTDLKVVSEYVETIAKFPVVSVVEEDNYTHLATQDAELKDHAVNVLYTIDIYTHGKNKKAIAKKIASAVDTVMLENLFTREFMGATPDVDRTIYRITMRYTAVVAEGVTVGTHTTYQMYRE